MSRKTLLKRTGIVLVGTLIALLAFEYGMNAIRAGRGGQAVRAARTPAELAGDTKIATEANMLLTSGAVTNLIASSKVDVCYIDYDAQGLFLAKNWYQKCYVRYVDGFDTALGKEQLRQKIESLPQANLVFGTSVGSQQNPIKGCQIFWSNYNFTVDYRPSGTLFSAYQCKIPDQTKDDLDMDPQPPTSMVTTKIIKSFDPYSVGKSQNQVWIRFDQYYYSENLGCAIPSLLCGSPRSKPAE